MDVEWIGQDEPERWDAALANIPHGYWHRWIPCRAASANTGLPVFLYVAHEQTGRVACPLMEREWRGSSDFATPIGISGFASSTAVLPESFPERWAAPLRERGAVCVYLAQHPLYAPTWPGCQESAAGTLFLLELTRSPQDWLRGVDENRRRSIRAWERAGRQWVRDRVQLTQFVVEHHAEFMRSLGASPACFYSDAALRFLCGDPTVELVGVHDDYGVSTVAAFGATRWGAELLFHISVREGRAHTAALMWWAVQHYHGSVPILNLGGTPQENDAVAAAKRRYRPREMRFRKMKCVLNLPLYEKLCVDSGVRADDLAGYFPRYRQPALHRSDECAENLADALASDQG